MFYGQGISVVKPGQSHVSSLCACGVVYVMCESICVHVCSYVVLSILVLLGFSAFLLILHVRVRTHTNRTLHRNTCAYY